MPLVFVHGVNVRAGDTEEEQRQFKLGEATRDELFRTVVFKNKNLHICNPYWGKFGPQFPNGGTPLAVPLPGGQMLGPSETALAEVLQAVTPYRIADITAQQQEDEVRDFFLRIAREVSLSVSVNALIAASSVIATEDTDEATQQVVKRRAAFAAQAAAYAQQPTPWLWEKDQDSGHYRLQTDEQFLQRLQAALPPTEISGQEALGVLDTFGKVLRKVHQTVRKVMQAVVHTVAGAVAGAAVGSAINVDPAVLALRPAVTRPVAIFLGDVFTYLASRGDKDNPGQIVQEILSTLREAAAVRTDKDPLIVIAHSMGGNIVYDILTSFAPDVKVDALVTVGSQVALFKEIGLYVEDQKGGDERSARLPVNLKRWINIYDRVDILGFALERIYGHQDNILEDYAFDNEQTPFGAHTAYFVQTRFHERLRVRLLEWEIINS